MFSSGSLKKGVGSTTSDCSSPGRNSSVSRLPVGIKSIGDESQNFRIQLAVHKYNNSNNGSGNSNCNLVSSPVKNSFFKSLNKSRSYESGTDLIQGEKKFENRYEGVGSFPTVHLKKSSVLYRPIRKFNGVKVPCPELPVNR